MARTRMVRRWRRNMDVLDDPKYVDLLTTLSEGSVRRNFNPYTDIDWDSPEFAVFDGDERWILPATDPLGRHRDRDALALLHRRRDPFRRARGGGDQGGGVAQPAIPGERISRPVSELLHSTLQNCGLASFCASNGRTSWTS